MTDRREKHVRHYREFELIDGVIEVQGPDGVKRIPAPSDWDIHDTTALRRVVEALGGTTVAPETDALFAYGPKVHDDEARETPFDSPPATLCERLSMIACTRAGPMTQDGGQIRGRLYDYESGCPWEIRADRVQPDLQPVRSES